jgi:hypothetical protein
MDGGWLAAECYWCAVRGGAGAGFDGSAGPSLVAPRLPAAGCCCRRAGLLPACGCCCRAVDAAALLLRLPAWLLWLAACLPVGLHQHSTQAQS